MRINYTPDEDNETGQSAADAAAAAAANPTPKDQPLSGEDLDKASLAAFSDGLAVAEGKKAPKEDADGVSDAVVIEDDDQVDGEAKPVAKAGEPAPKPGEEPKPDEAKPDAEIEKEIGERGLKGDSAKRFRELAAGNKRAIELDAEIAPLREAAARADRWEHMVQSTGAEPVQFGKALGLLKALNSNDPKLMGMAFDAMQDELRLLGARIGRSITSVDALDVDPALKARVKKGEIDRADAEEVLRTRTEAKLREEAEARRAQGSQVTQAQSAGVEAVRALGNELAALEDQAAPGRGLEIYKAKLSMLTPSIKIIQRTLPPEQWPVAIRDLYTALPAPSAAPAPAPRPPNPTRPTVGAAAHTMVDKPKDDVDAFSRGMDLAGKRA